MHIAGGRVVVAGYRTLVLRGFPTHMQHNPLSLLLRITELALGDSCASKMLMCERVEGWRNAANGEGRKGSYTIPKSTDLSSYEPPPILRHRSQTVVRGDAVELHSTRPRQGKSL